ncbi:heparan-alpha-glucosaminide N-acetyltransferase domain-containing protein [Trueperella sp. LYQ141]|uniref:heparan-alpha-glucosaminide N-acetyltransferase domain-containing protein n=1 Tax=Trueperella sp. LYQ141 TaxID=3391058 RepID=UPI0039835514
MTATHDAIQPLSRRYRGRIDGLDLARGLAILGMIWVHAGPMIDGAYWPTLLAEIPFGRSSALFALLAGVSLSIMTGRNVPYTGERLQHAQLRIVGRSLMLLVIAGILDLFQTPILLILGYYALWFLIALPFTRWSAGKLFIAAALLAAVGPTLHVYLNVILTRNDMLGSGGTNGIILDVLITGLYAGVGFMVYVLAGMGIGRLNITHRLVQCLLVIIGTICATVGYGISWLATRYLEPAIDFDTLNLSSLNSSGSLGSLASGSGASSAMPDLGSGVYPPSFPPHNANILQRIAYDFQSIIHYASDIFRPGPLSPAPDIPVDPTGDSSWKKPLWDGSADSLNLPDPTWADYLHGSPHSNTITEVIGNLGVTMAVLGLCLLIGFLARSVLLPVRALGSMSLTAYSLHVLLIGFLPAEMMGFSAAEFLVVGGLVLGFALAWKLFGIARGPLEWLMWRFSLWFARPALKHEETGPTPAQDAHPVRDPSPIHIQEQFSTPVPSVR